MRLRCISGHRRFITSSARSLILDSRAPWGPGTCIQRGARTMIARWWLLGTNPAVSQGTYMHLRGGTTAFDRFKKRGGELVIVDPRCTESVKRWGGHVPIHPGADIFLLLALL